MLRKLIVIFTILVFFCFIYGYRWFKNRELSYLQSKISSMTRDFMKLQAHLKEVESRIEIASGGELMVGMTNTALGKIEAAFLPMHFPLEKDFSGEIILESIHDVHFLADNTIHFRADVAGHNIRYEGNPGILGSFGKTLRNLLTIRSFSAAADCVGKLRFLKDLPGIEIGILVNSLRIPNVSPHLEELVMQQINREFEKNPQRIKIRFNPQEMQIEKKRRTVRIIPQNLRVSGNTLLLMGTARFEKDEISRPEHPGIGRKRPAPAVR